MMVSAVSAYASAAGSLASSSNANDKGYIAAMKRVSSGRKLVNASDAPADMAMVSRMSSLISREDAAISNAGNAVSYIQNADSQMQGVSNMMGRMQELAIQANDGTKSDQDRAALQAEFEQLQSNISSVTSGSSPLASYNGKATLQGDPVSIQTGPDAGQETVISSGDLSSSSTTVVGDDSGGNPVTWGDVLSPAGMNISSQAGAADALQKLSQASDYLDTLRATAGAQQVAVESAASGQMESMNNNISNVSRLDGGDLTKSAMELARYRNLGKVSSRMLEATTNRMLGVA